MIHQEQIEANHEPIRPGLAAVFQVRVGGWTLIESLSTINSASNGSSGHSGRPGQLTKESKLASTLTLDKQYKTSLVL